ncbi:unnamed protein product [Gordionus sp. m RMFG-2023]
MPIHDLKIKYILFVDALRKMEEKERKEQEAMRMNKKLEKDKRRLEIEQKRLQEHWNQDPSHNRITGKYTILLLY